MFHAFTFYSVYRHLIHHTKVVVVRAVKLRVVTVSSSMSARVCVSYVLAYILKKYTNIILCYSKIY